MTQTPEKTLRYPIVWLAIFAFVGFMFARMAQQQYETSVSENKYWELAIEEKILSIKKLMKGHPND